MKNRKKIMLLSVRRKWFKIPLTVLLFCALHPLSAQTDTTKSDYQQEFDAFKEASSGRV